MLYYLSRFWSKGFRRLMIIINMWLRRRVNGITITSSLTWRRNYWRLSFVSLSDYRCHSCQTHLVPRDWCNDLYVTLRYWFLVLRSFTPNRDSKRCSEDSLLRCSLGYWIVDWIFEPQIVDHTVLGKVGTPVTYISEGETRKRKYSEVYPREGIKRLCIIGYRM